MAFFNFKSSKKKSGSISFYDRENRIQNYKDLQFFFNLTASFSTTAPISYRGIPLVQITLKEMEEKLGEPMYMLDHEYRIAGHFVYFYKKKLEQLSLLMQLHFINDVFILAVSKFSTDYVLDNKDKNKLIAQLLINYPLTALPAEQHVLKFKDSDGNIIFTEENVFCYIHYVSNSAKVQKLKSQINWDNLPQANSDEISESLDSLI